MVEFPTYTGPPFIESNPKLLPIFPVERRIDCPCFHCKKKQFPLRLGWATTIHRCQGITVGPGEPNRYIVINPGTRQFESRVPGALYVALSRAKSSGTEDSEPDFASHPSILVNQDRLCHVVDTPLARARRSEIKRIEELDDITRKKFQT